MMRQEEWEDGYDFVEWIAAQPWCDGNVGMTGESYGGFSSLLVAAENPPHLKAIVPIYISDDFYETNQPGWQPAYGAPPDLRVDDARAQRASTIGGRQRASGWRRGKTNWRTTAPGLWPVFVTPVTAPIGTRRSVGRRFKNVRCPTYVMGGWHDVFISEPFKVFMGIDPDVPSKLLMGPYFHMSPWTGLPGPQVHHMHEMVRWFDQFLKGEETGITDEPPIRMFVREHDAPAIRRETRVGFLAIRDASGPRRAPKPRPTRSMGTVLWTRTATATAGAIRFRMIRRLG